MPGLTWCAFVQIRCLDSGRFHRQLLGSFFFVILVLSDVLPHVILCLGYHKVTLKLVQRIRRVDYVGAGEERLRADSKRVTVLHRVPATRMNITPL